MLFCLLSVWGSAIKFGGPMYSEWAQAQVNKITDVLKAARSDHTQAVKSRIEDVQKLNSVVDITKSLFEVSKVPPMPCLACSLVDDLYRKLHD